MKQSIALPVAHKNAEVASLFVRGIPDEQYQPKAPPHFRPERIVIAKGGRDDPQGRQLIDAACALYPQAQVVTQADLPHNRIDLEAPDLLTQHYRGKKTLVFGLHQSALRFSEEDGNACPNYWHFSPYGFCPYDCRYCYLAGTPGVKHSPTVKIFVNLPQMLSAIETVAAALTKPMAFYIGKLQDGLALDPLTGYSRIMVPFFARQRYARLTVLTKSANVENLLDLDHAGHTILSWSLNPPEIASAFEENVPTPQERLAAMQACAKAGYPLRAILMPIIPIEGWQTIYSRFLEQLLQLIPLQRITFGQICSYSGALHLMERKLGKRNPISTLLTGTQSPDGRFRFPFELRVRVYRHLLDQTNRIRPNLETALCLEERRTFAALDMTNALGRCNCVV